MNFICLIYNFFQCPFKKKKTTESFFLFLCNMEEELIKVIKVIRIIVVVAAIICAIMFVLSFTPLWDKII